MQTATGRKLICYGKGTGRELKIYYTEIKEDQSAATEKVQIKSFEKFN